MKLFLALASMVVVLSACTTTEPTEPVAEQLSMQQLTMSPGYSWFMAEMDSYLPKQSVLDDISTSMTANVNRRVCIFVKPSCSCRGTQRLFPQVVKELTAAKVDMSRVEIWSMRGTTDKHPYQSIITIGELPAIYVLENNAIRSMVSDKQYADTNAAELIANAVRD